MTDSLTLGIVAAFEQVEPGELRRLGVGYRLHVRLKVSALPVSDALAAGKAGEDERRRHHGA